MRTVMRDELDAYLRAIAGRTPASNFLELRYRVGEHALASHFERAHDRDAIAAAIARRARSSDVYIGCAPRCRRAGTKDAVAEVWTLWVECDGAAAADAVRRYVPEPAIIIGSGSGPNVHAYWPLRAPMAPREAERANLRLARAIGADRACFDATRILRPPGTWNHKHQPPAPVLPLRLRASQTFDAPDVVAHAPDLDHDRLARRWGDRPARKLVGDPLLQLLPAIYVSELLGVEARAGRKVHCPFHSDRHPSLHVYPTPERGWCCFSCGRAGSIYDLASALWGVQTRGREFRQLRRMLRERFAADLRLEPHARELRDPHALG